MARCVSVFADNSLLVLKYMTILYYIGHTRGGPCQHGFMCGCKQWSNDINESN